MIDRLTEGDEVRIRDWLDEIGETDRATISELITRAQNSERARAYLLGQAAAVERDRAHRAMFDFPPRARGDHSR